MAVEVLASLIELEEERFANFRIRAAEFWERPQPQASKRTVVANLEEMKRQKKDLPTLPQPPRSLLSAILKKKDYSHSQRSWKSSHSEPSRQTKLGYDLGPDAQAYIGSPTEPLDDKPVSKGSLASRSKSASFSEDSDVPSWLLWEWLCCCLWESFVQLPFELPCSLWTVLLHLNCHVVLQVTLSSFMLPMESHVHWIRFQIVLPWETAS